jgi:hypothetical protein
VLVGVVFCIADGEVWSVGVMGSGVVVGRVILLIGVGGLD